MESPRPISLRGYWPFIRSIVVAALLVFIRNGLDGCACAQHATDANNSIPASAFSILRPVATQNPSENQFHQPEIPQPRVFPLKPPLKQLSSQRGEATTRITRKLPALPVANPNRQPQDFLEDIPLKDDPQSMKGLDTDNLPLPSPRTDDEFMQENELLEQRERESTPYPRPDFSTPAERVVPLPIQRAPDDFKGFEPESPGDWNLPEPRRIYPLRKVETPQPPSINLRGQANESKPMPWHSGTFSTAPQFQSLLDGSSVQPAVSQRQAAPSYRTPSAQYESLPFHERLQSKRWQLQHASQLPTATSSTQVIVEQSCLVPYQPTDFAPIPFVAQPLNAQREIETYYGKTAVETQRPWVEWWRPFYTGGMYEPGVPVLSDVNLLTPSFLVYGDYRTAVGVHRDQGQNVRSWAHRLNLDMDLRLTGTERFHLFTGPLDHNGRFTRLDFSNGSAEFEEELDFQIDTAFFEGDLGAITGSLIGDDAPFDLPFTCGLVPLLYQNGIWMEDAIAGFAMGAPWKHNRALNWSNYEATFFAGFNQITSPAFNNDNNAAAVFGTAWFIEAYNGYIETDYAYLDDLDGLDRSYHNAAIAYTRRYFGRISNSVRLIGNIGQSGPAVNRSADGALLLFENSLISAQPSTFVPYWNCFVGSGRPQSVARANGAGGILRNTGINFETDALTNYPTLNATGSNSYGGAFGLQILSADFRKQWVTEFAALDTYGDPALSAAAGPEYALGTRYQTALNNRLIWRIDLMNGWFDNAPDIYGTRTEIRWKF